MKTPQPTIASHQIAELSGLSHAEVLRDIRQALAHVGIDPQKFAGRFLGDDGERKTCFMLSRRECDLFVSNYGVALAWPSSADPLLN